MRRSHTATAALAVCALMTFALAACKGTAERAKTDAPAPTPTTITTTAGQGTTATYQVQEADGNDAAQATPLPLPPGGKCPETTGSTFTVSNSEIKPGESVAVQWALPYGYAPALTEQTASGTSPVRIDFHHPASPRPLVGGGVTRQPRENTRYDLKAAAPQGCAPIEMFVDVKVVK